jgi:hypothetical protein
MTQVFESTICKRNMDLGLFSIIERLDYVLPCMSLEDITWKIDRQC